MFIKEIPAIVMEFAEYGNLNDYLMKQSQPIDWFLRMKWTTQLSDSLGMKRINKINNLVYLHRHQIIHRDIRCVNILVIFKLFWFKYLAFTKFRYQNFR